MSTKDMMIQIRYTCPACKGSGYVKADEAKLNDLVLAQLGQVPKTRRLYSKICCDICDNGLIYEWISLDKYIDEFIMNRNTYPL